MALYDQSYAPWTGAATGRLARIAAIVRPGLVQPFRNLWILFMVFFSFVLVAAWLIFLLSVATAAAKNPGIEALSRMLFAWGNNIYRTKFFNTDFFSMILMTLSIAVGAPLISNDLRHNALLMYFSKTITRGDYVLAKFLTLVIFLLLVTLGPALLLFAGQIAMGGERLTTGQRLADLRAITLHSLILVVPMSAVVLACSSVTKRAYVAGILWATIFFASLGFERLLTDLLEEDWCGLLSWTKLTGHLGDFCYEYRPPPDLGRMKNPPELKPQLAFGWGPPFLILSAVTAASLAWVRLRLRSAEAGE